MMVSRLVNLGGIKAKLINMKLFYQQEVGKNGGQQRNRFRVQIKHVGKKLNA